jgi:membrane-bound ClpP family serine protease
MIEIFLVPGIGLFAVGAILAMAVCGYLAFATYGLKMGAVVTFVMLALAITTVVIALKILARTKAGKDLILDSTVSSTATDDKQIYDEDLWVGRVMEAMTDLKPSGKAKYEGTTHLVRSEGKFLRNGNRLRVVKVVNNELYVEEIPGE